jgi:hypothetical protein
MQQEYHIFTSTLKARTALSKKYYQLMILRSNASIEGSEICKRFNTQTPVETHRTTST